MAKKTTSIRKVQDALAVHGLVCQVVQLAESTRTAEQAARAIGCRVEQIVKSLIFRGQHTNKPILVLVSGRNQVNEQRVSEVVGESITRADANFVREKTGFVIGGVPPIGHTEKLESFVDESLLQFEELWAAAGTPHAVFRLTGMDLLKMIDGDFISIT